MWKWFKGKHKHNWEVMWTKRIIDTGEKDKYECLYYQWQVHLLKCRECPEEQMVSTYINRRFSKTLTDEDMKGWVLEEI